MVEEEIQKGQLDASRREERLSYIADSERWARLEDRRQDAERQARKEIKVPGQLDVIEALLNPKTTPEQVRELCKDATMSRKNVEVEVGVFRNVEVSAWPIPPGSPLPIYLSQYAEQYIAALNHPRFPRCDVSKRPTNCLKQFWFLSRALAGAVCGVKTRTAINLVGSLRPEEMFREARDGKPARRHRKLRRK